VEIVCNLTIGHNHAQMRLALENQVMHTAYKFVQSSLTKTGPQGWRSLLLMSFIPIATILVFMIMNHILIQRHTGLSGFLATTVGMLFMDGTVLMIRLMLWLSCMPKLHFFVNFQKSLAKRGVNGLTKLPSTSVQMDTAGLIRDTKPQLCVMIGRDYMMDFTNQHLVSTKKVLKNH